MDPRQLPDEPRARNQGANHARGTRPVGLHHDDMRQSRVLEHLHAVKNDAPAAKALEQKATAEKNGVGEEEFAPWSIGPTL